jgi:co-chaperonin GroES (HSP10)
MRALGKYIAIQPIEEELKSGVMMLTGEDKKQQRYRRGRVISAGSEVVDTLKKDDVVYFDKANSFEMLIEDKNVTIIQSRDIVAVED